MAHCASSWTPLLMLLNGGMAQDRAQPTARRGGLTVGRGRRPGRWWDQAKLRLLIGGGAQLNWRRDVSAPSAPSDVLDPSASDGPAGMGPITAQRRMQENSSAVGLSFDTIAIVFSVLVGAAGYVIQGPQFL